MGKIVGVDLHLRRPSIICVLENLSARFFESGDEIKDIISLRPKIAVLDAPLSLKLPFRNFERELMKKGYKFLPLSMKSMKELTKKAMKIKEKLEKEEIEVFETHPGSLSKWIKVNIKKKDHKDAFLCAFVGYLYEKGIVNRVEEFLFL